MNIMKLPFGLSENSAVKEFNRKLWSYGRSGFMNLSYGSMRIWVFFSIFVCFLLLLLVVVNVAFEKNSGWDVIDSDECVEMGGQYNDEQNYCMLETRDKEWRCNSNSDCEGWCLAEEDAELGSRAYGKCSEAFSAQGCVKFIDEGMVNSICMP